MKITIHTSHQHAAPWLEAFAQGLRRHGHNPQFNAAGPADLAVMWGHGPRLAPIRQAQLASGGRYLVAEVGFFGDRLGTCSLGFDGLAGRAVWPEAPPGAARRKSWGLKAPEPASGGDAVLLLGQMPGDASLEGMDAARLFASIAADIRTQDARPLIWRPHPRARGMAQVLGADEVSTGDLSEALARAAVAVTWNSTAGVDAVLAGVPLIALDAGAMAWDVAGHSLADLGNPPRPGKREMERWLDALAWCQWRLAEVRSGAAWAHLKTLIEG